MVKKKTEGSKKRGEVTRCDDKGRGVRREQK